MRGGGRGQREKCVLRKREREGGIGQVGSNRYQKGD